MRLLAVQFAISIALVLLALAAVEAYLRLTIPGSSRESIYEYTLSTKRYKVMKPNAMVVAWGKELRTNELGFRDATPRLAPKRPGEFRIVVLGDSFTVAAGVDYARIYTTLLEERLKEKHPGARVINLAVGGYNVVQYAAVLEEVALGLEPDMVVVALYPENDFSMDTYEENFRIASGDTAAADVPWVQSLYTYRAYFGKVVNRFGRKEAPKADRSKGWDENIGALRAIARTTEEHGLPLAVIALPSTWALASQRPVFQRVESECARLPNARCFSLLEPLIASGIDEASLRLNALDAHPNEKYNAFVAEALAPFVAGFLN
ncbi:MAG TPA: GDSL-type esterase/lipase family protein [Burkholderiales bacterium]|nr:GDSL-type esterase/lipase family protein [Burkholderiales bacterium]